MNIFEQVQSLNLPLGQYVVVGSGAMAAYGIRDFKDIDILVTKELYESLEKAGWNENTSRADLIFLENGIFGAGQTMVTTPTYKPDTNELIRNGDIINGIAFLRLEDLLDFKRSLGRPKDEDDVKLITEYLSRSSPENAQPGI